MPSSFHRIGTAALALWFGLCCVTFTPAGRIALAQENAAVQTPPPAADTPEADPPDASPDTAAEQEPDDAVAPDAPETQQSGDSDEAVSPLRQAPEPENEPPVATDPPAPPAAAAPSQPAADAPKKDGALQGGGDFMKKMFAPGEKKEEPDRFDLDYAPSKPAPEGEKTPIYKNWILWTVVGVVAFAGTILIIQYGVDNSDNLSLNVTRRTP
jgi:hypothetical protein